MKKDSRIKLLRMDSNIGAAAARNVSIENAKGRYIAFLDSDDTWKPNKLERQLKFMSDNNYAFTYTAYELINEDGIKLNKIITVPESLNYKQYLKNTIIGCLTVIIDREKTGNFVMPLIKSSHDMALWLLIMKRGVIAFGFKEVTASYRLVSNSNTAKKWKAAKDVWLVYRNFEHLNITLSVYNFTLYAINAIIKRL
jgi:teichuronic acid biosynthesis glycosyltransferase TuaG